MSLSCTFFITSLATSQGAGDIIASRASLTSCFGSTEVGYLAVKVILHLESVSTFRPVHFLISSFVFH